MNKNKVAITLILFYLFSIYSLYDWLRFEKVNVIAIILSFAVLFYFVKNLDFVSHRGDESR